ncbi:MAG: hypothetical protein JOS17DRAFT_160792 [Linnemannia elongata]|nr:MAG: hypothetical protein JOS17DRAFT_160792 [Linnemannia elongata]
MNDTSFNCEHHSTQLLYVLNSTLTLLCGREPEFVSEYKTVAGHLLQITDYRNASALSWPEWFDADITYMDFFVPIGNNTGTSTFGLLKKAGTMYAFGNDNGFRYTHLIDKVNVTNSLGVDPNPPPMPAPSPSSLLTTGAIVGIVVGVVAVFAGTVLLVVRMNRKRRNKVNSTRAAVDKDDSTAAEDDNNIASSIKSGDDSGPNYLYLEGKHPYWRPSSTESLPLASMTTVPEHLQERLRVLQEQMRAVQAQAQATTQFSSHPRPNVVTTVSSEKEQSPTSDQDSATTATPSSRRGPRGPTALVPATGLTESMEMYAPSAPAYLGDIAQPPSLEAPNVEPLESVGSSNSAMVPTSLSSSTIDTILYTRPQP